MNPNIVVNKHLDIPGSQGERYQRPLLEFSENLNQMKFFCDVQY